MANVVTKITVNAETKDIGAKYNEKGQELVNVFADRQVLEDNYYTKDAIGVILDDYAERQYVDYYYAVKDHTHSDYAASDHTHSGYAANDHTHSDYVTTSTLNNYYTKSAIRDSYYDKQDLDTYFQTKDITVSVGTDTATTVEDALKKLNTYINDVSINSVQTDEMEEVVTQTVKSMKESGELTLEEKRTKTVEFSTKTKTVTVTPLSDFGHTITKIVLFDSEFSSDTEHGNIFIQFSDGTEKTSELGSSYWSKGSTFEIYDSLLVCTNSKGDKECVIGDDVTKQWAYFELRNLAQAISCMVFKEGWDDMKEEA